MIVSRLHRLFGDEVPVYPTEVHDFEWNFEAPASLVPLRVPTAEVLMATHPIPPEREGHELSGSPSFRTVSPVYPKEVHNLENSEASPSPSHLQVQTTEPVVTYSIPPGREGHELSGSPSTRKEARTLSMSCTSPIIMSLIHNCVSTERRAGRMSLDFISNKRTKGSHCQSDISYRESTDNAQVYNINHSISNEGGPKRSHSCVRRFKEMLNPSSPHFTTQRSGGGDDTFDRMEGSSRNKLTSTSTWIGADDRESTGGSGRDSYCADELEGSWTTEIQWD